jgi:hypothetical protein
MAERRTSAEESRVASLQRMVVVKVVRDGALDGEVCALGSGMALGASTPMSSTAAWYEGGTRRN